MGKEIIKFFNEVTLDICEGQAMDKEFENLDVISESLYLEMIKKKDGIFDCGISSTTLNLRE